MKYFNVILLVFVLGLVDSGLARAECKVTTNIDELVKQYVEEKAPNSPSDLAKIIEESDRHSAAASRAAAAAEAAAMGKPVSLEQRVQAARDELTALEKDFDADPLEKM